MSTGEGERRTGALHEMMLVLRAPNTFSGHQNASTWQMHFEILPPRWCHGADGVVDAACDAPLSCTSASPSTLFSF